MKRIISMFLCLFVVVAGFFSNEAFARDDGLSNGGINSLHSVLKRAASNGFLYTFWENDQIFDGTRIVSGTTQDMLRLKNSEKGTLIVRYQTESASNQVIFAAGNNNATNGYGAIMANNVPNVRIARFPQSIFQHKSQIRLTRH